MKKLEISDETYEKIKDQLAGDETPINNLDELQGKKFFFRTVTYHLIGKVEKRVEGTNIFVLSTASWVADSGRFMNALKKGTLAEVEPIGIAYINVDTVTDFFPWNHPLPTEQK